MKPVSMESIVELCLALDKQAVGVYRTLASAAKDKKLKRFWRHLSSEERKHVVFWRKLLRMVRSGAAPQVFSDSNGTACELAERSSKLESVASQASKTTDAKEQFLLASRLESCLLHPALDKLWQLYNSIAPGQPAPLKTYHTHINEFLGAIHEYVGYSTALEIIGEMVQQLWNQIRVATVESELDEMTNVHNRRSLLNIMTALAHLASRKRFSSGLLFIDIDHFKEINDHWGHRTGDAVLREVARIIWSNLRRSDVVGRYGGDEFLVFLPEVQPGYVRLVADKLRAAVERETHKGTAVTISIGAACRIIGKGVDIDADLESLIEESDRRLYQAKNDGRNRVACG